MRVKYYLRGLGCGIIFSAIVLSVSFSGKSDKQISDAEIIQRAKQLGMIDGEKGDTEEVGSELQENTEEEKIPVKVENEDNTSEKDTEIKSVADVKDEKKDSSGTNSKTDTLKEESDSKKENKEEESDNKEISKTKDESEVKDENSNKKENESQNESATAQTKEFVTITIRSGQVCRQIAEDLERKGIVDDAEAFRNYMGQRGLASSIRSGTFQVPKGASYKELADCLTNK